MGSSPAKRVDPITSGFPAGGIELGGLLLLLLIVGFVHLQLLPWAFDDAFIHFRVAAQLADAGEPYFNRGEAVMSSSAPGWTLFLAALFRLLTRELWIVAALNAFFTVAGGVVYARLVELLAQRRLPSGAPLAFAATYVAAVHFSSAGLMETPLALLLLGGALLALGRGSPVAFLLLAAAPFLRPELALFGLILFAESAWTRRVAPLRATLFGLAGALPFVAYQLYYFGTLVPHTALAKAKVYELTLRDSLLLLLQFTLPGTHLLPFTWLRYGSIIALFVSIGLGILALRGDGRRVDPQLRLTWLVLTSAILIPLSYVVMRGLVFPWYVPLFAAPLLLGATVVALRSRSVAASLLLALGVGLPYAADLVSSAVAAAGSPASYRYFAVNARVAKYRQLGARLAADYPGARLLSSEVGGLGYTFPGRILDGAGLITPQALPFHPMRVPEERSAGFFGAIPVGFVEQERPELIVSMDIFAEALLRSEIAKEYRLRREPIYVEADLRRVDRPILWGSRFMNILVRRDLVPRRSIRPRDGDSEQ